MRHTTTIAGRRAYRRMPGSTTVSVDINCNTWQHKGGQATASFPSKRCAQRGPATPDSPDEAPGADRPKPDSTPNTTQRTSKKCHPTGTGNARLTRSDPRGGQANARLNAPSHAAHAHSRPADPMLRACTTDDPTRGLLTACPTTGCPQGPHSQ